MQILPARAKKAHGVSLSIVPIFLLVLCIMGSMALVANRAAMRQQAFELDREKRQLTQSLGFEAESLLAAVARDEGLGELFQVQRSRETLERLLAALNRRQATDYAILIAKSDGHLLAEAGETETFSRRSAFMRRLVDSARMRGLDTTTIGIGREARVLQDGQGAFALATMPIGRSIILAVTRPIGAGALRRFSTMLAIPNLRLVGGEAPTETSIAVPGLAGEPVMSLVWMPSRAAAETLTDLAIFGLSASIGIAIVALVLFRRMRASTEALLMREAKASHEARHDPLSGLPNRAVFCDTLAENIEDLPNRDSSIAVLLLDLDKFKDVNDIYGHAAGDKVIVDFGNRVRALLRQTDMIARLGGDEFAVMQTGIRSHGETTWLAQAIIDAANRPFVMDGATMQIGVTIGISFAPDDGLEIAAILRAADTALYRAKNEGRNRFALYEHRMTESERIRKLVDDELRGAIDRDELTLVYQPQVHAENGRIASVEALVRWRHPSYGLISPATFISAAEERGLIVPLGQWVMRRACLDAARWPGLRVGVNVSAIQFRQQNFVRDVARTIEEAALEPGRLELELTEGVLVEDADQAEAAMVELRSIGVKLALDDFGTGYSSLIYLRRFAFDKIKIDKSFLDSMEATGESAILVHSVVHLGRALGLEVTAEGVETEEQRRFLQAVGCHFLQGYLFSKPVSADAIDEMLRAEAEADRGTTPPLSAA
ncbi:putative bifunctional diguanylate cyclase/phosphodiesterase [Rhabdaerophilum calidifontis]|uniref:putative bifunctional diguanylate cyclase/phosphodiesterase n=1 Tax=Rhabdaerophilum calidifontis TaxID=2604328 RepID=UPI00123C427A|nr:EAL domain-containing protein [Rhabdaerophilum calidifontis]